MINLGCRTLFRLNTLNDLQPASVFRDISCRLPVPWFDKYVPTNATHNYARLLAKIISHTSNINVLDCYDQVKLYRFNCTGLQKRSAY